MENEFMALGDLGRPTPGLVEPGYGILDNRTIKTAQDFAYAAADKACPPMNGLTQAEYDEQWQAAFDAKMRELGWEYTGDHCMCEDPDFGHEPACGWSKVNDDDTASFARTADSPGTIPEAEKSANK